MFKCQHERAVSPSGSSGTSISYKLSYQRYRELPLCSLQTRLGWLKTAKKEKNFDKYSVTSLKQHKIGM